MEQRWNNGTADSREANQFGDGHAHLARTLLVLVAELLCEVTRLEGQELIVIYVLGECCIQTGNSMLSTTIESERDSISFVRDYCGATWLTGQLLAQATGGTRRVGPSDDADNVAKFCLELLRGSEPRPEGFPSDG